MRKPSNPFIISGYHSPAYFCDRHKELVWLQEQFDNERNVVLYAWRRLGKTALIKHFFYKLKKEKKAEVLFVDLLGTANLAEANKRIALAIVTAFGDPEQGFGKRFLRLLGSIGVTFSLNHLSGMPEFTFGLVPSGEIPKSLEVIGAYLSEKEVPVVICIDEFQQIVNYPESNSESVFRTWMQEYPMLRFIFSGSHRHMMQSMFGEASRPFYNSTEMLELLPLSTEAYTHFVQKHFKKADKSISISNLERIAEWTRMQTYYMQLACNKLYGKTDKVNDSLIDIVFDEMVQQHSLFFSSYQHLLTAFQWRVLLALARSENVENPYSQEFLKTHSLGASSSVSAALKVLVAKELVISDDGIHKLHDVLLMRWMQLL